MKKRTPILILAVVLAFSLLTITAFANVPTYEGYEAFKTLMQNKSSLEEDIKNGTLVGSMTVQENDQVVATFSTTFKADALQKAGSGDVLIQAGEVERNLNVFFNEDITYVFDEANQEYYSVEKTDEMKAAYADEYDNEYDSSRRDFHGNSGEMTSAQEELFDFLVGELKDDFSVEYNSDESQTISFELINSEMPMLLNLIVSAGNSMDKDTMDIPENSSAMEALAIYPLFQELSALHTELPRIEDNLTLNVVKFSFTVDKNKDFQDVTFSMNVTGDDKNGVNHTQQIDGKFALTALGTTTVESPTLDDKTIISIDPTVFEDSMGDKHGMRNKGSRGGN